MKQYLDAVIASGRSPAVLEIGIDRGVTMIPLVVHLASRVGEYAVVGIDVFIQESLAITLQNIEHRRGAILLQGNSLELLPKIVEQAMKFDLVLIDGDHNYYTVSRELAYLDRLVRNDGLVMIDDYDGKWAERDLWYADRPGYESIATTTKQIDTEKHGVKPAVDEYLGANPQWVATRPIGGEPIVLRRKEIRK
jgi:predicted O-methyltransferase YrrM